MNIKNMCKNKLLLCILFWALLWQNAYPLSKDSLQKENDWKFAAGVTLYNNNLYEGGYISKPYKPFELNFRYKVGNSHVIRMTLPIAHKVELEEYSIANAYDGKESLEDYYDWMLKGIYAQQYFHTLENNYSLYGISLGYDYNYHFAPEFSAFGGIEFVYYYTKRKLQYYEIAYALNRDDNKSSIICMEHRKVNTNWNTKSVKPLAGIRYQFQKLLFEVSIGYSFYSNAITETISADYFYPDSNTSKRLDDKFVQPRYTYQQFEYQFSIYYTF